jgi:protein TonB
MTAESSHAGSVETNARVSASALYISTVGEITVKERSNAAAAIKAAIERVKRYPLIAKRRGIEGTATVEFRINDEGIPQKINIAASSGSDILDDAAIATITRAAPFPNDIRTIKVPVSFRLEKD